MTFRLSILIHFLLFVSLVNGQSVNIINQTFPACSGGCNGSITFSVIGSTGPFSVVASNTTCATSNTISFSSNTISINNLCACDSVYKFTFFDNSSSIIETETVSVYPLGLNVFATNSAISCSNTCDATGTVYVGNGTPPYSYTWSPTSSNSQVVSNLCPTNYTIDAVDSNGCKGSTLLIIVNWGPCAGINELQIKERLDIYPNPALNFIHVLLDESILINEALIQNVFGQTVMQTKDIKEINISTIPPGLYNLKIIAADKLYYSKFIKQ